MAQLNRILSSGGRVAMLITAIQVFAALTPATASTLSRPPLATKLLTASDLPAGWYVFPEKGTTQSVDLPTGGCLAKATSWLASHPSAQSASIQGSTTQGRSLFDEALATGENTKRHFQLLVRALGRCHDSPSEWRGFQVAVTAKALPIPVPGVSSHAFTVDFREGQGINTTDDRWDVLLFQIGTVYGSFQFHTNPNRITTFVMLSRAAINKIERSSVAPSSG
jgi:hypothetical protein